MGYVGVAFTPSDTVDDGWMVGGLTGFLVIRLNTIYTTRENEYSKRDLIYTAE